MAKEMWWSHTSEGLRTKELLGSWPKASHGCVDGRLTACLSAEEHQLSESSQTSPLRLPA